MSSRVPYGVSLVLVALTTVCGTGHAAGAELSSAPSNPVAKVEANAAAANRADPYITIHYAEAYEADPLDFVIELSGPSDKVVTVSYRTEHETATPITDYWHVEGRLTFARGETQKTVRVEVRDDDMVERPEELWLTLTDPFNAWFPSKQPECDRGCETDQCCVCGMILDRDVTRIWIDDAENWEYAGQVEFPVRTNNPTVWVYADYTTSDGTAVAEGDYASRTGTVTFRLSKRTTARVALQDDNIHEADETFTVTLTSTSHGIIEDPTGTGTILDDDDIGLSISDAQDWEYAGSIGFDVTVNEPMGADVEVQYSVSDGTATAADDYESESGVLTIRARTRSSTIVVGLIDDVLTEPDETFTVTLSSPSRGTILDGEGTGTILDDDGVELTIADAAGREDAGFLDFDVSTSAGLGADIRLEYTATDGTAVEGGDYYAPRTGVVDLRKRSTGGKISVALIDDVFAELDETFTLTLTSASRGIVREPEATGTIHDDDRPAFSVRDASALEGSRWMPFAVSLAQAPQTTVMVDYVGGETVAEAAVASRATPEVDYRGATGSLTFLPGETRKVVPVAIVDDAVEEPDERFPMALSNPRGDHAYLADGEAMGTIRDDDGRPPPALSVADASGSESGGDLAFRVTLDRASDEPVTASYSTSDGTALDGTDYNARSGRVRFAAGDRAATIRVPVIDDARDEPDETLTLTLADATNATFRDSEATGTIEDDDDAASTSIELSATPASVSEGAGARLVTVTATLDAGTRTTATAVTVSVTAGGASGAVGVAPVSDFEIEIAPGSTSGTGTFRVVPEDDAVDESGETLTVSGVSDLPVTGTTVAVTDDDAASTGIALSVFPSRVSEGSGAQEVTVTSTLNGGARPSDTPVTVTVSGSGDPDAVDYAPVDDFEIRIPANAASGTGTFRVAPEDDDQEEVDETLTVSGASDLPVTGATVTLADDDQMSTRVLLSLSASPSRAWEGGGPVRVTVTAQLDRGVRPQETVVAVTVSGRGDPGAVDFAPIDDFEIRIPANATSGMAVFTVTIEDDAEDERDETLTVSGASDLPVTPTSVTLYDDDEASVRILLAAEPSRVPEGGGAATVTVTASLDRGSRAEATVVTVTVSGSGDPDAVDFAAVADFGIVIAAGALSGTGVFDLDPEDDAADETDETVTVAGSSELPVTPATVVLEDDDQAPQQVFRVLLFESASNPWRQGFLRVVNHSQESGLVRIDAVDDGGVVRDPITLSLEGGEAAHFNSDDLENGNVEKGLSGGVGTPSRGEWRLKLSSELDIEVLAYSRTWRGFVTSMHDATPVEDGAHRVSFFNPGSNMDQTSLLRLVNTGADDVEATISGTDDAGVPSGEVRVSLPAGTAVTLGSAELESGDAGGIVSGALGTGMGKWRLAVRSTLPLAVKSLRESVGYLTNLSTSPATPGSTVDAHGVLLFPSMAEPGREGVVRVVNYSAAAGEVRIEARDDTDYEYELVTLAVPASGAAHFNSTDLELGNVGKGLTGSTGAGEGSWRLDLTSALDIEVLSYLRTVDGFLTAMHDVTPLGDGVHKVVFFNPSSNSQQVSRLRLINPGTSAATATVAGVDDAGASPGTPVRLRIEAGTALEVSSPALEAGDGEGIESGALGDGVGKWRLRVDSDTPIQVMSLLENPTGHLTNLSTAPK